MAQERDAYSLSVVECVGGRNCVGDAYRALQGADEKLVEALAGLVGVANILESLGGVLAGNIKDNLLTTTE